MAVSLPFQQHSNLSKMQSFSYSEHNFDLKYSWTWNMKKKFQWRAFMFSPTKKNKTNFIYLGTIQILRNRDFVRFLPHPPNM